MGGMALHSAAKEWWYVGCPRGMALHSDAKEWVACRMSPFVHWARFWRGGLGTTAKGEQRDDVVGGVGGGWRSGWAGRTTDSVVRCWTFC